MDKPFTWSCPRWLLRWPGINAPAVLAYLRLRELIERAPPTAVCVNLRQFAAELGGTKSAAGRWFDTLAKCGLIEPVDVARGRGSTWRVLDAEWVAERRGIRLAPADPQMPLFDTGEPADQSPPPLVVIDDPAAGTDCPGTGTIEPEPGQSTGTDCPGTGTNPDPGQSGDVSQDVDLVALVNNRRETLGFGPTRANIEYSKNVKCDIGEGPREGATVDPNAAPGARVDTRAQWLVDQFREAAGLYRWILTTAALAVETSELYVEGRPCAMTEAELAGLIQSATAKPPSVRGRYFVGGLKRILAASVDVPAERFTFPALGDLAQAVRACGGTWDFEQQKLPLRARRA